MMHLLPKRRAWPMLALALLLAVGPLLTAAAQGGSSINCSGLSDADCQILEAATQKTGDILSVSMPDWGLALSLDAGSDQSMQFETNGSGLLTLPSSALSLISDLPSMSGVTDIGPLMVLLQRLDAATVQTALNELGIVLAIEHASVQAPGTDMSGGGDLIFKDNGLYVRLESPTGADAWFGDTIDMTASNMDELNQTLEDAIAQLESDGTRATLAQASELSGSLNDIYGMLSDHISTTRGPDESLSGQTMIAFTTTFDLKGLLADPNLPTALLTLLNNPAMESLGINLQDVRDLNETQVHFLLMTVGLLVGDTSITLDQWVGADDGYLHKFGFNLGLNVDLSLMGGSSAFDHLNLNASFYTLMDDINTATLDGVSVPTVTHSLNDSDNFLVGNPGMIEANLEIGQTRSDSFTGSVDEQDMFGLPLHAGDTMTIEMVSEDYPYLDLYGPDGFKITTIDTYYDKALDFTAPVDGLYVIVGRAYWDMTYDLTIRAK